MARARRVDVPNDKFGAHIDWSLQCLRGQHSSTHNIDYEFVEAGDLRIDVTFYLSKWKVHNKWLSYDRCHEDTLCKEDPPSEEKAFLCDHAVITL